MIAGLMVGTALASIGVGMFDVKHYFHLQVLLECTRALKCMLWSIML